MILRIWRAEVDSERLEEYRRFERERCLPMLHKQPWLLGPRLHELREGPHQIVARLLAQFRPHTADGIDEALA